MSKVFTVIFFKDGTYEYHETDDGMVVKVTDEVSAVYNAKSKHDADDAINYGTYNELVKES